MVDSLIGRDEELNAVRAFLSTPREGPAVVMLEGEAASEDDAHWEAVIAAEGRPPGLRRGRGGRDGAVLRRAVRSARRRARGGSVELPRPSGTRSRWLCCSSRDDRTAEHQAVAAGFRGALCALTETDRLLVAIDDVQWFDRPSAAALAFTLRRLEGAGWTSCSPSGSRRACRAPSGSIDPLPSSSSSGCWIEPLSAAAVQRLIHIHLGATFPRPVLRRIHDTSGGNPFFALELARALGRVEPPAPGEPLPVPDTLHELVENRLAGLPEDDGGSASRLRCSASPAWRDSTPPSGRTPPMRFSRPSRLTWLASRRTGCTSRTRCSRRAWWRPPTQARAGRSIAVWPRWPSQRSARGTSRSRRRAPTSRWPRRSRLPPQPSLAAGRPRRRGVRASAPFA